MMMNDRRFVEAIGRVARVYARAEKNVRARARARARTNRLIIARTPVTDIPPRACECIYIYIYTSVKRARRIAALCPGGETTLASFGCLSALRYANIIRWKYICRGALSRL